MAQNSKNSKDSKNASKNKQAQREAKQLSRAERRERDRKLQEARLARAQKERRQQTIIGIIVAVVVVVILAVAGVVVWQKTHQSSTDTAAQSETVDDAYQDLQNVAVKPSKADDKGGILISKDGYGKSVADVPTVGIYMDFLCPGCGNLNRQLDQDLIKMMNAGQLNIDLHFMSFMDRYSTDDYSSRAANAALWIAEHDDNPDHLLQYMSNLYSSDFQPDEGSAYESVSNDQLKEQAINAGIPEEVMDGAFDGTYDDWLTAINTYTPKREELWNTSGSLAGSMSTPTVTINGYFWDTNNVTLANMTIAEGFLGAIELPADEVGVEGDLPGIGATGVPINVATGEPQSESTSSSDNSSSSE